MENKTPIRNPLFDDIVVEYDKYGDNPNTFIIPAGEIQEIDEKYVKHVVDKIYNEVVNTRNLNVIALNADIEAKKKIMDEIIINI